MKIFSKKIFEANGGDDQRFQRKFKHDWKWGSFFIFMGLIACFLPTLLLFPRNSSSIKYIIFYIIGDCLIPLLYYIFFEKRKTKKIFEEMLNNYPKCLKCGNCRIHHNRFYCIHELIFFKYFFKGELSDTYFEVIKINKKNCKLFIKNEGNWFNIGWKTPEYVKYSSSNFEKWKQLNCKGVEYSKEFWDFFRDKPKYH